MLARLIMGLVCIIITHSPCCCCVNRYLLSFVACMIDGWPWPALLMLRTLASAFGE
jgi:hypothetical protein